MQYYHSKVKWNRDKLEWKLEPGQGTSDLSTVGNVKPSPPYLMKRVACHNPNNVRAKWNRTELE
jgi:hypothetical protein